MKKKDALRLTIPNHLSYLDNARQFVIEAARRFGFTGAEFMPIEVGVEEAVTNVMKHAYDVEENPHFDIICEKLPAGIKIIIKERGIPFDPARIGDVLILQYLNNVELDYKRIVVWADIGRELRDYIEQHDPNAGL